MGDHRGRRDGRAVASLAPVCWFYDLNNYRCIYIYMYKYIYIYIYRERERERADDMHTQNSRGGKFDLDHFCRGVDYFVNLEKSLYNMFLTKGILFPEDRGSRF